MWGHIITEASYQYNFNTGFPSTRSDVLIHLAQWQYWWWFWFTFLWSFYYLVVVKTIRTRTLKMHPKIATTYRPHGKWGDFLACMIPAVWCINILTNSNFVLRLTEWQHESSLFTVRIHGRQWYWVYKMELKNFIDIIATPKNVGYNKWVLNSFGDLKTSNNYLHVLRLRYDNRFLKTYWEGKLKEAEKEYNFHITTPVVTKNNIRSGVSVNNLLLSSVTADSIFDSNSVLNQNVASKLPVSDSFKKSLKINVSEGNSKIAIPTQSPLHQLNTLKHNNNLDSLFTLNKKVGLFFEKNKQPYKETSEIVEPQVNFTTSKKNNISNLYPNTSRVLLSGNMFLSSKEEEGAFSTNNTPINDLMWDATDRFFLKYSKKNNLDNISIYTLLKDLNWDNNGKGASNTFYIRNSDHSDLNRWLKRGWGFKEPLRVIKYTNLLDQDIANGEANLNLFRFRFNDNNQNIVGKDVNNVYFAFKQKRYGVRKKFSIKKKFNKNIQNEVTSELSAPNKQRLRVLVKNKYFETINDKDATLSYKYIKKNRKYGEYMPIPLARRLLRTRRTLVLPAHVNIALITNSYDVVHSWFVPSLGIKVDCVPGRSTHHILYIDSVGFYYGQCAEICGRYHHHMPIRVCSLPFEHFLLWWHSYGAPKLMYTKSARKVGSYYANSKYSW